MNITAELNVLKFFLPIMVTHYIYSMEISLTQMK